MLSHEVSGQGYERDAEPNRHYHGAVRWWFFRSFDDGFVFARGGRVSTTRHARRELESAKGICHVEHAAFRSRPTHMLLEDGEIKEISR